MDANLQNWHAALERCLHAGLLEYGEFGPGDLLLILPRGGHTIMLGIALETSGVKPNGVAIRSWLLSVLPPNSPFHKAILCVQSRSCFAH